MTPIDGGPNTRLSRTMYGRSTDDLLIPHQKRTGDSITTRIRYHGFTHGQAKVGINPRGDRIFFALARGDSARYWLPVPPLVTPAPITASFRMQVPVAQRALAPGVLEQIDTLPYGHTLWRYRMDVPAPLGSIAVASGPYRARSLTSAIELWSYGDTAAPAAALARAGAMTEFYAARVGRYPYPRLVYAEAPVTAGVGAPGIVFYPERSPTGGPADTTVEIETARQWFGQAIVPATAEDGWITGGLARHLAALWRDRANGRRMLLPVDRLTEEMRGESAMRQLHAAVGDSAFFAGLRRFTADRLYRSAGRADFLRAMSAAAGRDLEPDLQQASGRGR